MEPKTMPKIGEQRLPCVKARTGSCYRVPGTNYQLETYRHTAEHALRRMDHKQLVVHGRVGPVFLEEVAHRHEHLPLRVAEIQERQRLVDLHVESSPGFGHRVECPGCIE